mmetsp:Transcript_33671/g.85137  ORF Transcript_33671/g.85137 Transcript_33671/m.85137 type:complete len:212 (-) Transcript_33671:194-829(-)
MTNWQIWGSARKSALTSTRRQRLWHISFLTWGEASLCRPKRPLRKAGRLTIRALGSLRMKCLTQWMAPALNSASGDCIWAMSLLSSPLRVSACCCEHSALLWSSHRRMRAASAPCDPPLPCASSLATTPGMSSGQASRVTMERRVVMICAAIMRLRLTSSPSTSRMLWRTKVRTFGSILWCCSLMVFLSSRPASCRSSMGASGILQKTTNM